MSTIKLEGMFVSFEQTSGEVNVISPLVFKISQHIFIWHDLMHVQNSLTL